MQQLRWQIAQFFELYWWRFYLANKPKKEYLAWKKAYWKAFLQKVGLELPANARVLDAGCGPAGIFTILDQQQVDALDPLLDQYAKKFPHFSPEDFPNVQFFNQPLEQFFPEKKYDVVFALNAINHVAELDTCMDRLVALTQPGGYLFLSVDAHRYRWLRRLFQLLPADILHPHQFTLEEYQDMLSRRGAKILRTVPLRSERIFNYYLLVAQLTVKQR